MTFPFIPPRPITINESYLTVLSESGLWKIQEWAEKVSAGEIAPKEVAFEVQRLINAVRDFRQSVIKEYESGDGLTTVAEAALLTGQSANSLYIRHHRGDFPEGVFIPVKPKGRRSKRPGYKVNVAALSTFLSEKRGHHSKQ